MHPELVLVLKTMAALAGSMVVFAGLILWIGTMWLNGRCMRDDEHD